MYEYMNYSLRNKKKMSRYESMTRLERYYLDKYGRNGYPDSYYGYGRYWPATRYYYYDDPVYTSRDWYLEPRRRALYRSLYGSRSDYSYRTGLYDGYRSYRGYDDTYSYYPRYSRYSY